MQTDIIISGFGGQGVLFAGQLLAYAGLAEGKHVTWIPSYGPEMRGGTAHCTVIISDEEIGSPLVRNPAVAMVFNPPSLQKYEPLVKSGGLLIGDSTLIGEHVPRPDIRHAELPAKEIAAALGFPQIANVVMVGALVGATGVLQMETLHRVLDEHVGERHRAALEPNKQALRRGAEWVAQKVNA
jgi:2-oxoglutarate ferredoxin oxidoreductase subunit gamma